MGLLTKHCFVLIPLFLMFLQVLDEDTVGWTSAHKGKWLHCPPYFDSFHICYKSCIYLYKEYICLIKENFGPNFLCYFYMYFYYACFYKNESLQLWRRWHWKRDCPQYLNSLKKGKGKAGMNQCLMIEYELSVNSDSHSWILDSAATSHVCMSLQVL